MSVVIFSEHLIVWRQNRGMARVAKCQIFYTDQFFPNEFTPRKGAYIVTNCRPKMHEMSKEGKFKGKTTKDDIIEAVLKTKRHVSC